MSNVSLDTTTWWYLAVGWDCSALKWPKSGGIGARQARGLRAGQPLETEKSVRLGKGENDLRLTFESSAFGDGELRLFCSVTAAYSHLPPILAHGDGNGVVGRRRRVLAQGGDQAVEGPDRVEVTEVQCVEDHPDRESVRVGELPGDVRPQPGREGGLVGDRAVGVGGGEIVSTLLKGFYARPRPDLVPHGMEVFTASFPSGHALLSAVTYLTLGALMTRIQAGPRLKLYVMAVAVAVTLLVGASRIYLGVHWPTDVLAGWCLGAAWAVLCWLMADLLRPGEAAPISLQPEEAGR